MPKTQHFALNKNQKILLKTIIYAKQSNDLANSLEPFDVETYDRDMQDIQDIQATGKDSITMPNQSNYKISLNKEDTNYEYLASQLQKYLEFKKRGEQQKAVFSLF